MAGSDRRAPRGRTPGQVPWSCAPESPRLHPGPSSPVPASGALKGVFTPHPAQPRVRTDAITRCRLGHDSLGQLLTQQQTNNSTGQQGSISKGNDSMSPPQGSHLISSPKHQQITHPIRDVSPKLEKSSSEDRNTNDSILKRAKGLNKHFSKENIQMTNKHSKPSGNANQNHT